MDDVCTIEGHYDGHLFGGDMWWECPYSGDMMHSFGQFDCDGEYYWHDVYGENGLLLYKVKSL